MLAGWLAVCIFKLIKLTWAGNNNTEQNISSFPRTALKSVKEGRGTISTTDTRARLRLLAQRVYIGWNWSRQTGCKRRLHYYKIKIKSCNVWAVHATPTPSQSLLLPLSSLSASVCVCVCLRWASVVALCCLLMVSFSRRNKQSEATLGWVAQPAVSILVPD